MSAQDIWARKYHELWEKLEKNTKDSFCTAWWKWLVATNNTDVVIAAAVQCNTGYGLDDTEDVTNDHERRKQPDMIDYLKHVEDAVKKFHNKGVHLDLS